MHIRPVTKANFDYLLGAVDDWWARPTAGKLHPVYLYQFETGLSRRRRVGG